MKTSLFSTRNIKAFIGICAVVISATGCSVFQKSGEMSLVLVDQGRPAAEIILGNNPTKSAQLGAFELQHHVKLITAAEIPILEQASGKDVVRIFIGNYPGKVQPQAISETITRKFRGKDIILSGGDTTGYGKVDYNNFWTFPCTTPGKKVYGYNGSLFAVYDFLEDLCDVRFFWPGDAGTGDAGTVYDKRKTLQVKQVDREHTSPYDAFRVIPRNFNWPGSMAKEVRLWVLRRREMDCFGKASHNSDSIYFAHWAKASDTNLAKAFIGKRPEMFAKGYEGKSPGAVGLTQYYKGDTNLPPQICFSSPDAVEFYAQEALTYFNGRNAIGGWDNPKGDIPTSETLLPRFPGKPFFYPWESLDSSRFCKCPECTKMMEGDNASRAKLDFISRVAKRAAELNPEIGISTLLYAQTFVYPEGMTLPENMSFQLCIPIYTWWHPEAKRIQQQEYRKWVDSKGNRLMTLWVYIFSTYWDAKYWHGNYKCFPGFYPWKTGEIIKNFSKDGFRGFFAESMWEINSLEIYVASRVAYDPTVDVDALLDDYFKKCYGKAAASMKAFYRESEDAYWRQDNCPPEWKKACGKYEVMGPKGPRSAFWCTGLISPDIAWGKMGTDERVARMDKLLKKADREVNTAFGRTQVDRMKEIWKTALEGQQEYKQNKSKQTGKEPISQDNRM